MRKKTFQIHFMASMLVWLCALAQEVDAQNANALHFDGINDFVATTCPGITGNAGRSVEAWVKTTANCIPTAGGLQQVICDWGTFVTGGRFTLNLLWSNSVRIEVGGSGLSGTTAINDGIWHHVAATYDPSSLNNKFKLYIDGELEVQGNIPTTVNTGSQYDVRIGKRVDDVNHFEGAIDEVRIWNSVRTPSQIQAHWDSQLCTDEPDLVAYYQFNQGNAGGNNVGENDLDDTFGNLNGNLYLFSYVGPTSNWVDGAPLPTVAIGTETIDSCAPLQGPNGEFWTESGTYNVTYPLESGCDSTVLVTFNYTPVLGDTVFLQTCESNLEFAGSTLTSSGFYEFGLSTVNGLCDSLVWADVNFWTASDTTFNNLSLCAGESLVLPDGSTTNEAGAFPVNLTNVQGCDSIVVSLVEVTDPSIELDSMPGDESLIWYAVDAPEGMAFSWLDCEADWAAVLDQTQDTLFLQLAGSYALATNLLGCTDTTACVDVPAVNDVRDLSNFQHIQVHPNPIQRGNPIHIPRHLAGGTWSILDAHGRIMASSSGNESTISLPAHLSSGQYILQIATGTKLHQAQLILLP